ncbi:outer membrane protein [Aminobacter sp. UC22_36]|uniref:outer membrane protein n=1 Tax=Aminobacter sp. UC22_36 TaxID=3374549 RepID=UPI00375772D3
MTFGKTLRVLLLGAASAGAIGQAAFAADSVAEAPAAGFNWSGIYVGFGGGVGAALTGMSPTSLASINAFGGDGAFAELSLGYDHLVGDRLLVGALIDARIGKIQSQGFIFDPDVQIGGKYGFDAGLRLGYLLAPSTLGYVVGGYSWQRMEFRAPVAIGDTDWGVDGYFVGAGMETVLTGNWTLKTEYRYSDYGAADPLPALGAPTGEFALDTSTHTFSIGANYRFGGSNGTAATFSAPAYNWSGFYIGGSAGAGAMLTDASDSGFIPLSGDGVFGELSVGYDHQIGENWVVGLVADARYGGISSSLAFLSGELEFKADYGFDLLARVGLKMSDATLAYALAGYGWQNFELSASGLGPSMELDDSASGFVVGGGFEVAISEKTAVNLEYRYSKYGDLDFDTGFVQLEPSSHTVRVGAKYKFN